MSKFTLIVAEKPTAAERIARALDKKNKPKAFKEKGVPYFVAKREKEIVVVPAIGHLYTVTQRDKGKHHYPVYDLKWVPRHLVEKSARRVKAFVELISKLAMHANVFIDACDYDTEGSLIGYNILNFACGKADVARRMKYSTLTNAELANAYEHPLPRLDFTLIDAGKTRHEVDWLYGINLSRALTYAVKKASGRYTTLSTGRVQGPTLRFLVLRENIIACFVPTPYWTIKAQVEIQGKPYEADYEKKMVESRAEADVVVESCRGKTGQIADLEKRTFKQAPPTPFDLGTLQSEAYHHFHFNPKRTIDIAERLYLDALISYPRTSSQKLPPTINYRVILSGLGREPTYKKPVSELLGLETLRPREGKKEDSAHPAVYPTGNLPERKLDASRQRLLDLIVKRFMAGFGEPALKQSMKAEIHVDGHRFFLRGLKTLKEGWMRYYKPYVQFTGALLPDTEEGEKIIVRDIICQDTFTKPPPRYNPNSLLKKMEKEEIGTKATRADIIQTLYRRKYIAEENMKVTELGLSVTETLQKYVPTIISVKLTRELEEKLWRIRNREEKPDDVLDQAIGRLKSVLEELKSQETTIGQALNEALQQAKLQERVVGNCPICKIGKLLIIFSRKTGKRFVGCSNYFEGSCTTSFPIPQFGTVKTTKTACSTCGWPNVVVYRRGRNPWRLCLNPACPNKRRKKRFEMQAM